MNRTVRDITHAAGRSVTVAHPLSGHSLPESEVKSRRPARWAKERLDGGAGTRHTRRMPGVLAKLLRGSAEVFRLASFFDPAADPWERIPHAVPAKAFGLASERDFGAYLQGPSRVQVRNLEELCTWLQGCEAMDDSVLFFQTDYWQHPVTFEHLRKGDCEDHALWAWRQLHRMGIPALFMAGLWETTAHAWVLIEHSPVPCLLESTTKSGPMLHALPKVRSAYSPALAVDTSGRTYVYQGYPRFRDVGISNNPASSC